MKTILAAGLSIGAVFVASAGAQAPAVPVHIRNLQGCFHVSYRFVEDGQHDYEIKDALEWVALKRHSGSYVLQHYGLYDGDVTEHFNETWSLLADGSWQQDVGPARYTCVSAVRMGQLHCSSSGAPKPIRDRKRDDYDLLNRVSTIQITPKGWVQNEVNDKVTKAGKIVATEVGWVEYRRTDGDTPCADAMKLAPSD